MKKSNKEEFIEKSNICHNNKYDYSLVEYKNNKTKVKILCSEHGIFEQRPNEHLYGQGCPECKKLKLRKLKIFSTEKFIEMSIIIHGNKFDYSLSNYNGTDEKVKIICPIHNIFEQSPHNHLQGQGCPKCKFEKIKDNGRDTKDMFIEKAKKIHKEKYDYSLVDYKRSKKKVKILCNKHGIFEQQPNHHLNGGGCPKCNESKGEKIIREYLENNNINYIPQKRFKDCKHKKLLRFDFYLSDHNLCIEYDGEQHYNPIETFGGILEYEKCLIKDEVKNQYCKDKNIKLIRISYLEINEIEKILQNNFLFKI